MAIVSKFPGLALLPQVAATGVIDVRKYASQFDKGTRIQVVPFKDPGGLVSFLTDLPQGQPAPAQQTAVAQMVNDAWKYDESLFAWTQPGPLVVLLYSDKQAKTQLGVGTYGAAVDGHTFGAPVALANSDPKQLAGNKDTVGHEVSHCLGQQAMSRIDSPEITNQLVKAAIGKEIINGATKARNNFYRMPVYFEEGKAWGVGNRFPGLLNNADSLAHVRQMIGKHTGEETAKVMAHFRSSSSEDGHWIDVGGEEFGALFFEYMRTRVQVAGQATPGVPDMFVRYGKLAQALGKLGDIKTSLQFGKLKTEYASLFKQAYGVDPEAALAQYVQFMTATEHNDQARYEGTIYDVRGPQYAIPDTLPGNTEAQNAALWYRSLNGKASTLSEKALLAWYEALPGVQAMKKR